MKPFRVEKFSSEVRQIVSDAIRNHLQDPRISPMTSVTRVEVTSDLEWANVYVSVMGEAADHRRTMAGLNSAAGFIQKLLARGLQARQCPHLIFHLDESINRGNEVMRQIEASMRELAGPEEPRRAEEPGEERPGSGAVE